MNEVFIRLIADGGVLLAIGVGAWAAWFKLSPQFDRWLAYRYAIMAGLTSLLIAKLISVAYQPNLERPFIELGLPAGAAFLDNPGFPSDHALFVSVIALAVITLTRNIRWSIIVVVIALLTSSGRVLALVHTPLDVIGGIVAALIGAVWYINMSHQKIKYQSKQKHV